MNKIQTTQKRNKTISYIYAGLIAMLVIVCGITIALVNANRTGAKSEIGGNEVVQVATTTFVVPMKNATIAKDYSGTELQFNETLKQWEIHKAIDFLAGDDLNVYVINDGTVSNIYTNYLEGTVIEVSHKNGLVSIYKSLNKDVNVAIGDKISAGNVIGAVAESMAQELKSGAHLHFEMKKDGKLVNPNDYLDLGIK